MFAWDPGALRGEALRSGPSPSTKRRTPKRGESVFPQNSAHLRILMLNGDIRGLASFWRCYHLARELSRLGHEVRLITVSRTRRVTPQTERSDRLSLIESPNLLDLVYGLGAGYGVLGIPYRMLEVARGRFDIVHAFEARPNVLLPAMLSRFLNGCPLVADWADWWGFTGDGSGSQERSRWPVPQLETAAEEFIHREAEEVTTISTGLRDRALSLGIPSDRVWWIPSGAPADAIRPLDKMSCRRELGISPSAYIIGYLGSDLRDLDMLSPALAPLRRSHTQVKLGIIAPRPSTLLGPGFRDAVIPFGHVPFSRLPLYLGACDAFVLALRDTVFNRNRWPNKFGDYLAAGRPILCSNVGDVARIVEEERCGVVWSDLAEFIDGAKALIDNQPAADAIGAAARRVAEGRLSWSSLALQFLSVYQHAVALA